MDLIMAPALWHLAVVGLLLAPDPIHAAPVPHALGSPKLRTAVVSAGSTLTSAPLRRLQPTPGGLLPKWPKFSANGDLSSVFTRWASWGLPCLVASAALYLLGCGRRKGSRPWLALSTGPAELDSVRERWRVKELDPRFTHLLVDIQTRAAARQPDEPQLADETRALLEGHGLDVSAILKAYPSLIATPTELIAQRIDNLTRLGLDVRAVVLAQPELLGAGEAMVTKTFEYLQARGFDIAKLLKRSLGPLRYTSNKLERTFQALESHGLDPVTVTMRHPPVMGFSEANITARVEYFRAVGFDYKRLLTAMPCLFAVGVPTLDKKIAVLHALGIDVVRAVRLVPGVLRLEAAGLESKIQVLRDLGLNPKLVVGRFPAVLMKSEQSCKDRVEYLRGLGLDVHKVVHGFPPVLGLGLENLQTKVTFLREEMQLPIEALNNCPTYFGYNLENRIMPRFRFLVYAGRKFANVGTVVTRSEARFACDVAWRSLAEYVEWKKHHYDPPRQKARPQTPDS
eukprot:EG_transcript_9775